MADREPESDIVSVTVTTQYGAFTAPTHKLAVRLARTQERTISAAKARAVEDTERAGERAMAAGFRIVRNIAWQADGTKSSVFDFVPSGDKCRSLAVWKDGEVGKTLIVHFQDGDAEYHVGRRLLGMLMGGNGYPLAVFTVGSDGSGELCEALGHCGGKVQSVVVPNVTHTDFNEWK